MMPGPCPLVLNAHPLAPVQHQGDGVTYDTAAVRAAAAALAAANGGTLLFPGPEGAAVATTANIGVRPPLRACHRVWCLRPLGPL